ncbi:LysR family transcriptional regulator [Paraburkholderia sp. A1RI_3L]|uniref:LysR family transcriptional regulator n=1 Tax=Paraburkholderia TaxID=1822464 RepID=UPI003B78EF63
MAMDLDIGSLRVFLACVRLGSISRAAQAFGRTQPALSQQLRRLEELVGDALFQRAAKGVSLTDAGMALLPYAERIVALSGEALAAAPRATLSGRCSVGLLEDLTGTALPAAFADFSCLHPSTTLELLVLGGAETMAALEAGRIQLALCDAAFLERPLRWGTHVPLWWAAAEGFDAFSDPLPLVLFSEPCRWRNVIFSALAQAGRQWKVAFESGSLSAVQAAVRAGVGVATLLPTATGPGIARVPDAVGLPVLPDIEIGLARRAGNEEDGLVNAVEALLKQLVA